MRAADRLARTLLLSARHALHSVEALRFRVGLSHVRTLLGLSIVFVTLAVVDLAGLVHPNLAVTATWGLLHLSFACFGGLSRVHLCGT
jgi:hypothetical protein